MQITVKVNPHRGKDPAVVVRDRLTTLRPDLGLNAPVEEVFPGLKTGNRAGMVIVRLPYDMPEEELETILQGLREDADVEYAEPAIPRTHRLRF